MMRSFPDFIKYAFPILRWIPRYSRGDAGRDLLAGLTVGVMLIPMAMAYAVLAGVPPIYGLYASLVPLLIYPLFGTSRHLSVGPVAIDMLIVAAGVGALAEVGTARYFALAVLLAAFVGLIEMVLGVVKLGFLVNLLSRPVIDGFTSAAALIIAASQLGNLLGVGLPRSEYVHLMVWEALQRAGQIDPVSLLIGTISIAVLILGQWWKKLFPGALVVVVGATLAVWGLHERGIELTSLDIVGNIPVGLPSPALPELAWQDLRDLLPTAGTLALVQFMSVVSLGKVFGARHRYSINANRELFAIGAANLAGSFFRSLPVSGSFSRSAVNEQAGARSALSNAAAAALIALTLLFLTPLFFYLPMPALAAIIIVAAFKLIDVGEVRFLFRVKQRDGYLALFTFAITLFVGIQEGILLGIVASMVLLIYRISQPHAAELGHLPGTRSFRDLDRNPEAMPVEGLLILRVDASLTFSNVAFLKERILAPRHPDEVPLRAVLIDGSSINDVDTTAVAGLNDISEALAARGIDLYFTGLHGPVRDIMRRSGLHARIGDAHFLMSPHRAVKQLLAEWDAADSTQRLARYEEATEPTGEKEERG